MSLEREVEDTSHPTTGAEENEGDQQGTFELIRRVENRPLLYDSQMKEHKDRYLVKNAWVEVANGLLIDGKSVTDKDCSAKWKRLKDYYYRKKKNSIGKSGDGAVTKKPWAYQTAMARVLQKTQQENEETVSNLENIESTQNDESRDLPIQEEVETDSPNMPSTSRNADSNANGEIPTSNKEKKRRSSSTVDESTQQLIKMLEDSSKQEDEYFHFGMNIAERLRKLSPRSCTKAQFKLSEVMFVVECPPSDESEVSDEA